MEEFLKGVEQLAVSLGFSPTTVLNVPFDTKERRDFARRLGGNFFVQDERLKGVALPADGQVRDHDPISGECRLIPQHGVVLVVTDAQGCEACFGFFKFPEHVIDIHGSILADTGLGGRWSFRDFVDVPDPRYREIVRRFEAAGYAKQVKDEYAWVQKDGRFKAQRRRRATCGQFLRARSHSHTRITVQPALRKVRFTSVVLRN